MPAAALMSFVKAPEIPALKKPANFAISLLAQRNGGKRGRRSGAAGADAQSPHRLELHHTLNMMR
jgi:hypothetical protein